jgi:hypothetical protein
MGAEQVVRIGLLPAQAKLMSDTTTPIIGFSGGIGSGKTRGVILKAIDLCRLNPGLPGILALPTYVMISDVFVPELEEVLDLMQIPYTPRKAPTREYVLHFDDGDSTIRLRSTEDPLKAGSGSTVAWVILDEVDQMKPEAVKRVKQRCRHPKAKVKQQVWCGTPEGRGTLYKTFVKNPPRNRETGEVLTRLIKAPTDDNHHLDPIYLSTAFEGLTQEEENMLRRGDFILPRGRVYAQLQDHHVKPITNRLGGRLVMCADFNVSPMAWTLGNIIHGRLQLWGEIVRDNTNTIEQAPIAAAVWQHILNADREGKRPLSMHEAASRVEVFCDASGKARRSSASASDVEHLRAQGFNVTHPTTNPPIKDRVFSVNLMFSGDRIWIDPECEQAVECFQNQTYAKNGEPDKSKGYDHIPDGVGYLVHYEWPAEFPKGNSGWVQSI